jgi:DNA-binding NtrC family response regulator
MVGEKTERLEPTRIHLSRASLLVLEGSSTGQFHVLPTGEFPLGSDPAAGLRLTDRGVSRRHAVIEYADGEYVLKDLGSTNGTYVNGRRIQTILLVAGDLIGIGTSRLRFEPRLEEVRVPPTTTDRFGPLYGQSLAMRQLFGILERAAPSETTMLIQGESGTGKDVVAQAVHAASPRAVRPFIVFDCSSVSGELIASELFGHLEGAFTGASRSRKGAFETASGGTIFLDEIGELPLELQPKLLRVLEAKEVRPVGSSTAVPVNARVLAATNRDLATRVKEGKFRQDLYFRLAVVMVELPPLRHRRDDVPGLVAHLVDHLAGAAEGVTLTDDALAVLMAQSWPGNVRELRNVLERTITLARSQTIDVRDLMIASVGAPSPGPLGELAGRTLEEIEREVIRQTMVRTGGNQREAARVLGIHRGTLRQKLDRYGIMGRQAKDDPETD